MRDEEQKHRKQASRTCGRGLCVLHARARLSTAKARSLQKQSRHNAELARPAGVSSCKNGKRNERPATNSSLRKNNVGTNWRACSCTRGALVLSVGDNRRLPLQHGTIRWLLLPQWDLIGRTLDEVDARCFHIPSAYRPKQRKNYVTKQERGCAN